MTQLRFIMCYSRVSRLLIPLACLASMLLFPFATLAAEPVRIGVLAFRPKQQAIVQWQPLAAILKKAVPEREFVVEVFTFPELEAAVARHQLDFVLTNPGHYVLMAKQIGLSAPLATLAVNQDGKPSSSFGGVIFTRATQAGINSLSDIKGKTAAATGTDSFGGYQMQAYELLQAGIRIPKEVKLITTGMPHDKVVEAVLAGRADVGFVRTGVLEAMASEGKLDNSQIKPLNQMRPPGYPFQVSTHLYPEWAFAVLPHVDEILARHVAAALYVLDDNTTAVRSMGIHGFVVPPDYTSVADLLKELRLPPFDKAPSFNLQDILERYYWQVMGALFAITVILLLGLSLLLSKRKLELQYHILQQQKQQLQESQDQIHLLLNATAEGIYGMDVHGCCTFVNTAFLQKLGYQDANEIVGKRLHDLIHHSHLDGTLYPQEECKAATVCQRNEQVHVNDEVFWRRDGSHFAVEYWSFPIISNGQTVGSVTSFFDITQRKQMEEQIRQLAFYDPLTKLPNRRLLNDRLSLAMADSKRSGCHGALMFLDLDNFKPLNDAHGHAIGDLLLIEAANRLKACVREADTVCRLGGDEFVVMINHLHPGRAESADHAKLIAEKIRDSLSRAYLLTRESEEGLDSAIEHHCTASIGVALFLSHEASQEDIMKWADTAMYQAKEAGRNSIRFYDPMAE